MEIKTAEEQAGAKRATTLQGIILAAAAAFCSEGILAIQLEGQSLFGSIARTAIVFLSIYTIHRFARESLRTYKPSPKDLATLTLVLVASIVIIWLGQILSIGLATYASTTSFFSSVSETTLQYAIPYAGGALLIQAILGIHFGLVFSLSLALIIGVYSQSDPIKVAYVLITCIMACLSFSRFRSRSAYLRAGFYIALIALPFALGSIVIEGSMSPADIAVRLGSALVCGMLSAFLVAGFTPILEYLGGYVTDMRLIEMATIDHPLLKELSIQAPGTWNHSMVMGMMSEAAADAIGANAVLARVGAYFHDIGKMKKPLYFVENQGGGENRHDKLSTSMSALIIRSHVKDGIELAQKHKLPLPIIDMIPQHHGSSVIEYFYDKACKEAEEAGEDPAEVDKSLYSYPGPKPQVKEAGILMLADGIEAAARTLSDPSQDRIQGMVQKMINKVFASGQLNECDLTLRDLHLIAKSFTRVLSSIYHQRIAYAEPAEKGTEKGDKEKPQAEKKVNGKKNEELASRNTDQDESKESESDESEDGDTEDLKRLGI